MTLHSLLFFFFFCFHQFCTKFLYFCTAPQVEIMKEYVDKKDKQTDKQTDAHFFHYNQPIALWHWRLVLHSISRPNKSNSTSCEYINRLPVDPKSFFLVKSQSVVLDPAISRFFFFDSRILLHSSLKKTGTGMNLFDRKAKVKNRQN